MNFLTITDQYINQNENYSEVDLVEHGYNLGLKAGGQSAGVYQTVITDALYLLKHIKDDLKWSNTAAHLLVLETNFNLEEWNKLHQTISRLESLHPATDDAIEFANWLAKNQWQGSTLFHEPVQLWQQHDYDRELDKYTMSKEFTSEDLYSVFRKEIGTTSPNATERQEGEKDYAEFQEWRKGVIPGTNGTGTDLYFYWLNNIKTNK